jgi:DNA mismatch repair protein MutS2
LQTETLLAEIQAAYRQAAEARDEAQLSQRAAADQQRRLTARLAGIDAERDSILGEARAEARRELNQVHQEIEALRAEMAGRGARGTLGDEWLSQARTRLAEQEKKVAPRPPAPRPEEVFLPGEIAVGDTVWVPGLGTIGQVMSLEGESAAVQVGSFHVRVQRSDLERRGRPAEAERQAPSAPRIAHPSPGMELDLRGQRVEEIEPRLDKYLDDAFLAGLPFVHIIHGKGTGALRQAVRNRLQGHPLVKSHRLGEDGEGGTGVTVVTLQGDK